MPPIRLLALGSSTRIIMAGRRNSKADMRISSCCSTWSLVRASSVANVVLSR